MKKIGIGLVLVLFFAVYTLFWTKVDFKIFKSSPSPQEDSPRLQNTKTQSVLSGRSLVLPTEHTLPPTYEINVIARKQVFNLSCEFAAAAAILYHYTALSEFALGNKETAERTLMQKVGVSSNPNLGVRMGLSKGEFNADQLYSNLNEKFGGTDYYGVHAPPFIDLFAQYGLQAVPMRKDLVDIPTLQKALYSGHLLMSWIRIGYGKSVDVALSYGSVPVVKGEHVVVVDGYDQNGVVVMDPATGTKRHLSYEQLFDASGSFTIPFLEISLALQPAISLENQVSLGVSTGLLRNKLSIAVENGSRKVGRGNELAQILSDFGYSITSLKNATDTDYENVTIAIKKPLTDYLFLLKKDLEISKYTIASISGDLSASSSADVVITVGE